MFEAPLTDVICVDTNAETVYFYTNPGNGQKDTQLAVNYRARPFDEEFYEKISRCLRTYQQKNPVNPMTKVSLVLPDYVFLTDTIHIPTIGKRAMENSLELAVGAIYKNKNELRYRTFPMAQNKQYATYGLVGVRKDLLSRLDKICSEAQMSLQNVTFAANAMVNGATMLSPKLKNGTYLMMDVRESETRYAFVNKGRTVGSYRLPFGYSMLYKTRLAAEDLLFDHSSAELLVLNAQERAKAKQLTMMGEEVLVDPDEQEPQEQTGEESQDELGFSSKKTARRLPKFMLRETPTDREGFVYENFRILMKWTLDLLASNSEITALGEISTVYVNMPEGLEFLYPMINAEEQENKVQFAPLLDKPAPQGEYLDLYGGLFVKLCNKINNF